MKIFGPESGTYRKKWRFENFSDPKFQNFNTYTFLINSRQKLLLNKIELGINKTIRSYKQTGDLAICLSCLYGVVSHFDELIKPGNKNELLNKIFMGFCIGK